MTGLKMPLPLLAVLTLCKFYLARGYGYPDLVNSTANAGQALVFFGDSFLDDHNYVEMQKAQHNSTFFQPPYDNNGAITNSQSLVNRLQTHLEVADKPVNVYNYAVAGATATNTTVSPCELIGDVQCAEGVPQLKQQVEQYLNDLGDAQVPPSHVIFLQIGTTDFVDVNSIQTLAGKVDAFDVALREAIAMLISRGARVIMLSTLPPGELAPAANKNVLASYVGVAFKLFNRNLNQTVDELRQEYDNVTFPLVELHQTITQLVNQAQEEGWNTTTSCLDLDKYKAFYIDEAGLVRNVTANKTQIANMTCPDQCTSFFWDSIHPTTCAYDRIAMDALPQFEEALNKASENTQEALKVTEEAPQSVEDTANKAVDSEQPSNVEEASGSFLTQLTQAATLVIATAITTVAFY